ncbi:hypothetical protein BsWGS_14794 [Bradybaena similaris]
MDNVIFSCVCRTSIHHQFCLHDEPTTSTIRNNQRCSHNYCNVIHKTAWNDSFANSFKLFQAENLTRDSSGMSPLTDCTIIDCTTEILPLAMSDNSWEEHEGSSIFWDHHTTNWEEHEGSSVQQ